MSGVEDARRSRGSGLTLVGYRGAGKSSVGRIVADRLGLRFEDADRYLEQKEGRSISSIFAESGEPYFRELERLAVHDLTSGDSIVLATGGGAILREDNRRAIRDFGPVVWLRASPEELARRIEADASRGASRPSLTSAGTLGEIRPVLESRIPIYQAVADFVVDAETGALLDVADLVVAAWRSFTDRPDNPDLGERS